MDLASLGLVPLDEPRPSLDLESLGLVPLDVPTAPPALPAQPTGSSAAPASWWDQRVPNIVAASNQLADKIQNPWTPPPIPLVDSANRLAAERRQNTTAPPMTDWDYVSGGYGDPLQSPPIPRVADALPQLDEPQPPQEDWLRRQAPVPWGPGPQFVDAWRPGQRTFDEMKGSTQPNVPLVRGEGERLNKRHQEWLSNVDKWGSADWEAYHNSLPVPIDNFTLADPEQFERAKFINQLITGEPYIGLTKEQQADERKKIARYRQQMKDTGYDDPVEWVAQIESHIGPQSLPGRMAQSAWEGLKEGTESLFKGTARTLGDLANELGYENSLRAGMGGDAEILQDAREREWREKVESRKDLRSASPFASKALRMTTGTLGRMAAPLAAGGGAPTFGLMMADTFNDTYNTQRAQGVDVPEAFANAGVQAIIEGGTEIAGGAVAKRAGLVNLESAFSRQSVKAIQNAVRKGGVKTMLTVAGGALGEGAEEAAAEVLGGIRDALFNYPVDMSNLPMSFTVGTLAGLAGHVPAVAKFLANPTRKNANDAGLPPGLTTKQLQEAAVQAASIVADTGVSRGNQASMYTPEQVAAMTPEERAYHGLQEDTGLPPQWPAESQPEAPSVAPPDVPPAELPSFPPPVDSGVAAGAQAADAEIVPEPEPVESPTDESVQEESARLFRENYAAVSADPPSATSQNLRRAIGYANGVIESELRKARAGEPYNEPLVDSLRREEEWYKSILREREREATSPKKRLDKKSPPTITPVQEPTYEVQTEGREEGRQGQVEPPPVEPIAPPPAKKTIGKKRPIITSQEFRQQLTAAATSPEEADALYGLVEARAEAAGESLDDYVGKRIAGVEKGPQSGSVAIKQGALRPGRLPRGEIQFLEDGRAIIRAFEEAQDLSTLVHELGHLFRRDLTSSELATAEQWAGVKDGKWTRTAEEKFARGFERYLRDGKAPTPALAKIFHKFQLWLSSVYRKLKGSPLDVKITPKMRAVYDSLFVGKRLGKKPSEPAFTLDENSSNKAWMQKRDSFIEDAASRVSGQTARKTRRLAKTMHAVTVRAAVEAGLPVPADVLADYPSLLALQKKPDVEVEPAQAPAEEQLPAWVTDEFPPESFGDTARTPLTPKEARRVETRMRQLSKVLDEKLHAELSSLPIEDIAAILQEADSRADADNQYHNELLDDYKQLFGGDGGYWKRIAKQVERKALDPDSIPKFDIKVQAVRDGGYPSLEGEAMFRGNGNLEEGLFDIVMDGVRGLESNRVKSEDFIEDALEAYRESTQQREPEAIGEPDRVPPSEGDGASEGGDRGAEGVPEVEEEAGVYAIGEKTWFAGDEVEVTSAPYELHGGEFQDASVLDTGKTVTIATPRSRDKRTAENQRAFREQQDEFARLKDDDFRPKKTVTTDQDDADFGHAGYVENGQLVAWFVTDDPSRVIKKLEGNIPLELDSDPGDIGAGGLYVSGVPQLWMGRAAAKYAVFEGLKPSDRKRVADKARADINRLTNSGYIAKFEGENALRWLDEYEELGNAGTLALISDQPYNIRIWEDRWLNDVGLSQPAQPKQIPVRLTGKFAQIESQLTPSQVDSLKQQGYDGAFFRGGMVQTGQLVVWNNNSVVKFGDYERPSDDFQLTGEGSRDTSPIVEPYVPPERMAPSTRDKERQGFLTTEMEPGSLPGQQGLFEGKQATLKGATGAALPPIASTAEGMATTPEGKSLLNKLRADSGAEKPKVGLRTIVEYLMDLAHTKLLVGNTQTSKRNPAHYLGKINSKGRPTGDGPHIVRSRNGYSHVNIHEVGHAISAFLAAKAPKWHADMAADLIAITKMDGSAASAENAEEGWAELVRRYVVLPQSLDPTLVKQFEDVMTKHAPDVLDGLKDGQKAYAYHRKRPVMEQLQSLMNDKPKPQGFAKQTKDTLYRALFATIGGNTVLHRLYRRSWAGIGGDTIVTKYDPTGISGLAKASFDKIYAEQQQVAQRFFKEIEDTPADVQSAYQSMLHVPGESNRAFWGADRGQEGIRVRATGEGLQQLHPDDIQVLSEGGFILPNGDSRHGNWIYLNKTSFDAIRQKVGSDNWHAFETWGQMRAALNRYETKGHEYPLMNDGLTPEALREFVDSTLKQHPDWDDRFREINDFMDQLLLVPVLAGEFTAQEAVTIKNSWGDYWPLPRQVDGKSSKSGGGGVEPSAGVRAAFGSQLPFRSLSEAVETRVKSAMEAYYTNRMMLAVKNYGKAIGALTEAPFDVRKDGERLMLPLKMDMKVVARLSAPEQAAIAADAINEMAAEQLGISVAELPEDAKVSPDDVIISTPGRPVYRSKKPNATHVVRVFENGKGKYYQVPDPLLFDFFASNRITPHSYFRWMGMIFRGMAAPWKRGVTQNIVFALRNALARDPFTAVSLADEKSLKAIVPGYLIATGAVNRLTGESLDALSQSELLSRSLDRTTTRPHQTLVKSFVDMLSEGIIPDRYGEMPWYDKVASAPGQVMSTLLKPIDVFNYVTLGRKLSSFGEELPREGAYLQKIRQGYSEERAQVAYDESTGNFGQRGGNPEAAELIRAAGFLNPALQILWGQTMKITHPNPQARAYFVSAKMPAVAVVSAIGAALNQVLIGLMYDDDDKEVVRNSMKERQDNDRLSSMSIGGKVRMPFDYGIVGAAQSYGWNVVEQWLLESPMKTDVKARELLSRATELPGIADMLPPAFKTWIELNAGPTGHSFFLDSDIVPAWLVRQFRHNPELQGFPETPYAYKKIGEWMGVSPLKVRYAVQNILSRELDSAITTLERPNKDATDFLIVGRLLDREAAGFDSQSVESLMDLNYNYQVLKDQASEETDPAKLAELEAQMAPLEAYHEGANLVDKVWDVAKTRRESGDMPGYNRIKRIMVGVGRDVLGLPPLQGYPDPWKSWNSLPDDVKDAMKKYTGAKAKVAVLGHGMPNKIDTEEKKETDAEYAARVQDWRKRRDDSKAWLRSHKSSPIVQQAVKAVRAEIPSRPAFNGGKDGYDPTYLKRRDAWNAKYGESAAMVNELTAP